MDIVYPIQESLQISLNTIMLKVENTPYLNEVDKLNSGVLHIYLSNTGLLDGHHISQTSEAIGCQYRYFFLNFSEPINVSLYQGQEGFLSLTPLYFTPSSPPSPSSPSSLSPPSSSSRRDSTNMIGIIILLILIFFIFLRINK